MLEQIEVMYYAVKNGEGAEKVSGICRELVRSTEQHFINEEKYMVSIHYQGLDEHRNEHHRLREETRKFLLRIEQNFPAANTGIFHLLRELFIEHILIEDKQFGKFYRATMESSPD